MQSSKIVYSTPSWKKSVNDKAVVRSSVDELSIRESVCESPTSVVACASVIVIITAMIRCFINYDTR